MQFVVLVVVLVRKEENVASLTAQLSLELSTNALILSRKCGNLLLIPFCAAMMAEDSCHLAFQFLDSLLQLPTRDDW